MQCLGQVFIISSLLVLLLSFAENDPKDGSYTKGMEFIKDFTVFVVKSTTELL